MLHFNNSNLNLHLHHIHKIIFGAKVAIGGVHTITARSDGVYSSFGSN